MTDSVQPSELLLTGCSSSDLFSTLLVDPKTGVSAWSHKGSELQGGSVAKAVPLGQNGEHIIFSLKDRPFMHVIGVNSHERFHQRSSICGVVRDMVVNSDGSLLFVAIDKRIFVWLLSNGELLGVRDAHLRDITCIGLSMDDSTIVTSSDDGGVRVFLVSDLMSECDGITPLRDWQAHSLSVTGLSLSSSNSLRVASCSLDHTANIYSVAMDTCLLRICSDRPFTSIALCSSESRLMVGSDKGVIACVSLYEAAKNDMKEILISTTNTASTDFLLQGRHTDKITRLAINSDGTLLASGDASGKYVIWQIGSKQVLKESTMHGEISTLCFVPFWRSITNPSDRMIERPNLNLGRTIGENKEIMLLRRDEMNSEEYWMDVIDNLLDGGDKKKDRVQIRDEEEDEDGTVKDDIIKKLRMENMKLKRINKELYEFTTTEVFQLKKK